MWAMKKTLYLLFKNLTLPSLSLAQIKGGGGHCTLLICSHHATLNLGSLVNTVESCE